MFLSTVNLPRHAVTNISSVKLLPKYIVLFQEMHFQGNTYTIEFPHRMRTHSTQHVGRIRPYCQYEVFFDNKDSYHAQESPSDSCGHVPNTQVGLLSMHSCEKSLLAHCVGKDASVRSPLKEIKVCSIFRSAGTMTMHVSLQDVATIILVLHAFSHQEDDEYMAV